VAKATEAAIRQRLASGIKDQNVRSSKNLL
jgi:hypothetical protein